MVSMPGVVSHYLWISPALALALALPWCLARETWETRGTSRRAERERVDRWETYGT